MTKQDLHLILFEQVGDVAHYFILVGGGLSRNTLLNHMLEFVGLLTLCLVVLWLRFAFFLRISSTGFTSYDSFIKLEVIRRDDITEVYLLGLLICYLLWLILYLIFGWVFLAASVFYGCKVSNCFELSWDLTPCFQIFGVYGCVVAVP